MIMEGLSAANIDFGALAHVFDPSAYAGAKGDGLWKTVVANGSYSGMNGAALRTAASGVGTKVKAVSLNSNAGYCIEDDEGNGAWDYIGGNATPSGTYKLATIQSGDCATAAGSAAS